MRSTRILLRNPLKKPVPKRTPPRVNVGNGKDKRAVRSMLESMRDRDWYSLANANTTGMNTTMSELKNIGSIPAGESSSPLIWHTDAVFREKLVELLFILQRDVRLDQMKYSKAEGIVDENLLAKCKVFSVNSFENNLAVALNEFKEPNEVTLLHLLVPTAKTLPNTIFHLIHPNVNISNTKTITDFFSKYKQPALTSLAAQLHYIIETTLFHYIKSSQSTYIPPQDQRLDITNPAEWYPEARTIKRKLILHVGPTNSGKTYNALQRLKESNNGYFAGPLRLLAREVHDRIKAEGIACNLVTGEEIVEDLDAFGNRAPLSCGTIEMIDLKTYFDVAVLDEIQMIGDPGRGWAWTNALLGVRAKEVHLCGEASVVDLIYKIAQLTGDEVVVNHYQRLGELHAEKKALTNGIMDLRRGDCVVVFSKKKILSLKARIEEETKLKCAVVYGALPAETRSAEALRFNKGEADVLIASDAIGMGLNLKIDRVVFETHKKFNGKANIEIEIPQVKQIAGRAGRFKVAPSAPGSSSKSQVSKSQDVVVAEDKEKSIGYVNSFHPRTLSYVKDALASPTKMLQRAYLWPSDEVWSHYMSSFPSDVSFGTVIRAFEEEVHASRLFKISSSEDRLNLVSVFQKFKELLIGDRLRMSTAPLNLRLEGAEDVLKEFSQVVANSSSKGPFMFRSLDFETVLSKKLIGISSVDTKNLGELETLHKFLMVWLWMNNRYPTLFVDREGAEDLKVLIEDRIESILNESEGRD